MTTSASETPAARPDDAAGRPQPVALEVPVTVNGARTVEGSEKREPFSESTMTVLVFGNGAVIRLASTVTPGQLLFLTNDKTKKEVVCQVVKSKNYRSVSGYVELEFTEAVSGFWGMRFPEERTPAQSATPAAKIPSPAVNNAPRPAPVSPAAAKPADTNVSPTRTIPATNVLVSPATTAVQTPAAKTEAKQSSPVNLPRVTAAQTITALPKTVAPDALGLGVTSLPRKPEVKPAAPVVTQTKPVTPNTEPATDALRLESARLQKQLSSLSFTPAAPTKPASPAPVAGKQANTDAPSKVIEMVKKEPVHIAAAPPAKITPVKMGSALDVEEVKIPSWLEPLARNAATPAPAELAAKDEASQVDASQEFEVQDVATIPVAQETAAPAEPIFDNSPLADSTTDAQTASRRSNKGIWIGAIAAGILVVAAGGAWYVRQSSSSAQGTVAAATAPATAAASVVQPQTQAQGGAEARTPSNAGIAPAASSPASPQHPASQVPANSVQAIRNGASSTSNSSSNSTSYAAQELAAYKQLAEPEPKKPTLGAVRLATPNVNRSAVSHENGELAPSLNEGQVSPNASALGGGIVVVDAKGPAAPSAPLPVGGDVKPARLVSSVQPIYPMLAKNQHVSGDVRIDALVDINGRISSMKIVSGPSLLHQAAMDALRQWKYQPATLNGGPVSMHLTVTIQFRLQ